MYRGETSGMMAQARNGALGRTLAPRRLRHVQRREKSRDLAVFRDEGEGVGASAAEVAIVYPAPSGCGLGPTRSGGGGYGGRGRGDLRVWNDRSGWSLTV